MGRDAAVRELIGAALEVQHALRRNPRARLILPRWAHAALSSQEFAALLYDVLRSEFLDLEARLTVTVASCEHFRVETQAAKGQSDGSP